MGSWRGTRTVALIAVGLLAIAAACDDDGGGSSDDASNPPSVFINAPGSDQVLVREASFEIAGGLGGSVNTIDVSIDNVGEPPPAAYEVVVRGVSDAGFEREATHVVTITGTAPRAEPDPTTTQPPPPTTAPSGTVKVLSDDFEGADRWTATVTRSTNGADATAERAGGGNPGGQRRMAHVLPGTADGENNPTQIAVLHVFGGGGWEPATDGALASVDYSEDQIEFEPPFDGAAIGALLVIVQDGTTYSTPIYENNAFSNTAWQTTSVDGLTPADFSPAPGPDFSADGGPMTFGYLRSNTGRSSTGITTQHGIDNWTVELFGVGS